MSSDFVIFPPGKSGNSVRLKAKNIKELRMETIQLERQNQEMEQRLNQLRQSMSREKEERERSNAYHWKSGQVGNQGQNHDKENAGKISSGKIKLKVLKTLDPEPVKQKTFSRTTDITATEKPKLRGKACGQCESKSALLMCLECGENYCAACFAKIHQKGALKLHRTLPIQGKSQDGKLDAFRKEVNVDEPSGKLDKGKEITDNMASTGVSSFNEKHSASGEAFISVPTKSYMSDTTGSLLHGTFNEEESAKYFNDALLEWRDGISQKPQHHLHADADGIGNSEAQTVLTMLAKPCDIEFKENGLSYMDKLILKKYRRTPVNLVPSKHLDKVRYSPTISETEMDECNHLTAEEMEAHEHYVALFSTKEQVTNDMRHEPALKMIEVDKGTEEELEESSLFLVTEVESNETKSQQSLSEPKKHYMVSAKVSSKSPVQSLEKHCSVPLLYANGLAKEGAVKSSQDNNICVKASHLEDSKSIQYKSFKDRQSLDTALMVNVPQQFESIVLRERNTVSEYHGLKGFFILETDHTEVESDQCPLSRPDPSALDEEITYTGHNYWKPDSSLTDHADDAVVEDIVAQAKCSNHFIEHSLSPRYFKQTKTGSWSGRAYSALSMHRISGSHSTSRPSTAAARPLSRAASEISEIELIDSKDKDDLLLEDENDKEALAVLEKEFIDLHSGDKKVQIPIPNDGSFLVTRHAKRVTVSEEQASIKRSLGYTLQSRAEESESDEEDTLQDKLNVLSLQ
ncbi:zinc finger B-box domain-containing protein 1 isoform X2 [Pseudophryne corroboree]|uniref:zinc finger B-box domain-containing protein 1 isoform X2 n=1 Tax=Pseudophryne corroboree TaxID=495146 RepID=UPI003081CBF1